MQPWCNLEYIFDLIRKFQFSSNGIALRVLFHAEIVFNNRLENHFPWPGRKTLANEIAECSRTVTYFSMRVTCTLLPSESRSSKWTVKQAKSHDRTIVNFRVSTLLFGRWLTPAAHEASFALTRCSKKHNTSCNARENRFQKISRNDLEDRFVSDRN